MFQTGDYIIYGTRGVCRVKEISTLDFGSASKGKLYYTLVPQYQENSTVYVPVESSGSIMRPIMSREEALELLDSISEIEELSVQNEKNRELAYKNAIKGCDNRELVRVIKTINRRGRSRMAAGKKTTAADDRYVKIAEENLYGELSLSLGIPREEIKKCIAARIKTAMQNA